MAVEAFPAGRCRPAESRSRVEGAFRTGRRSGPGRRARQGGGSGEHLAVPYSPSLDFGDPEFLVRYAFVIFLDRDERFRLMQTELDARLAQLDRFRAREIRDEPWLPGVDQPRMAQILDHVHGYKDLALDAHVRRLEQTLAERTEKTG
ncbi:hypothetical protein [Streptomyces sp. SID12501]|uniref:Uncharacterized protein n=1 Tax=Streptomyces sp. SID12501 TaxID=2706042 RepID=A0A6B3BTI1_9ACTN|nr:hypothetical protein [Streptomyces sp. SID12501]NEC87654.1 hypothetical protein [Streptomyces sp. SID12501]